MNNISVYRYPGSYAEEHNELPQYRASKKANIDCRDAIEGAIKNYTNWKSVGGCSACIAEFDPDKALDDVLILFPIERVAWVVANTIREKDWDRRFSDTNKRWAATIPVPSDPRPCNGNANVQFVIGTAHPCMVDSFASKVRGRYYAWKEQGV